MGYILDEFGTDGKRIFDVLVSKDKKTVEFSEACDNYFSAELTKGEMQQLINELQDIHDTMLG